MPAAALLVLLLLPDGVEVDFGTTAAARVRLLRHDNEGVRRRAALLLAHAAPDEAIAGLLGALADRSAGVRAAAAHAIGRLEDERAVPFLATVLEKERVDRVVVEVLRALGRCGGPYVARRVRPFLVHPDAPVRAAAVEALGEIGDAGQRDALWSALRYAPDDPGFIVRATVLGAFVRLGWREDVRRALDELEEMGALRHWASRAAMVAAVGAARIAERTDWIRREVRESPDPRVVAAAARTLTQLGHADEVLGLLDHASPSVRRAALVALQDAGDPRAVERAHAMVEKDPAADVRFEAALVLHHARHPDADLYLVDALRSQNPLFWISALAALEEKHGRSFGRNPDRWAEFLREGRGGS